MQSLFTRLGNRDGGERGWPKAASLFLFFFLFIGVLGCLPYQKTYVAKIFLSQWFLAGMVAFFYLRNKWLRAFLIWITLRMSMSYRVLNNHALFVFFSIILAMMFYQFVQDKIKRKDFLDIVCVVAITQLFWVYLQIFGMDPIFKPGPLYIYHSNLYAGFMGNPNLSGILIAICLPAFFRRKWIWFLPLFVYPFYRIECITAMFALAVGVFFYLYHKKHIIWPVAILGPIAWFLGGHRIIGFTQGPRFTLWTNLAPILKHRPIVGNGVGQYKFISGPAISTLKDMHLFNWSTAHNDLLQLYSEVGAIAILILTGYLVTLFLKRGMDLNLSTMIVIGLICSLGFFVFYTPVALLLLGAAALLEKGGKNDYPLYRTET